MTTTKLKKHQTGLYRVIGHTQARVLINPLVHNRKKVIAIEFVQTPQGRKLIGHCGEKFSDSKYDGENCTEIDTVKSIRFLEDEIFGV